MSEPTTPAAVDIHHGNAARFVAHSLGADGAIILLSMPDGTVQPLAHGVNHSRANEMLSIGIYVNLDQHYGELRKGAAGQEAAEHQKHIDQINNRG